MRNISINFKTVSGETMKSMGCYNIKFSVITDDKATFSHDFYILGSLYEGIILGIDFMTKYQLILFPRKRSLGYIRDNKPYTIELCETPVMHIDFLEEQTQIIVDKQYKHIIEGLLEKHPYCYAENMSQMTSVPTIEHRINTIGEPPCERMRRTAHALRPILKMKIDELLKYNIIRKSISQFTAPIVMVRKKNNEYRMCIDYRRLNDCTIREKFPIPNVCDTIDGLGGAKYFTTLDLYSGYYQLSIHEEDRHKTSFVCEYGQFEFNRLPFGLVNAPSAFQRTITAIFNEIHFDFLLIYLDDLIIFSKSKEEHTRHLELVFKILHTAGLKLNLRKCNFFQTEIEYLGFLISGKGVKPIKRNVEAIKNFPVPRTVKQVKGFIGLALYYKRFVRDFAGMAHPLYELLKKDTKWEWEEKHQESFEVLKTALTSCMRHPEFSRDFIVQTDSSGYGVGAILCQMQPKVSLDPEEKEPRLDKDVYNDKENEIEELEEVVIAYSSKKLDKKQMKYSATELECYAIIHAITVFKPYLYGRRFIVKCDHRPLQWLMSKAEPAGKLSRWAMKIQEFQFDIEYKKGKDNLNADALSRMPINNVSIWYPKMDDWVIAQQTDEYCRTILEKLSLPVPQKDMNDAKYTILPNGIIARVDGRIVVPEGKRNEVLELNHDHKLAGHPGISRTLARLKERYSWPYMAIDVTNYVNKCEKCAKRKSYGATKAPLKSMPTTNKVMQMVAADICGPVTESKHGFKYILVVTDYASRYVITVPMIDQTAKTIAKHLVYDVFTIFGGATSMLTDKGTNLLAGVVQTICDLFGVERITTTSFHPQTDGLTERFNRTMADMLACFVNKTPDLWCEYLTFITMAYNTTPHSTTKFSPFYLFYGREANMPNDICPPIRYRAVENYGEMVSQQWNIALEIARQNVEKAQVTQKKYYDEGSAIISFKVGEKVMLAEPPNKPGKFNMKWEGPHTVITRISDLNYRIQHNYTKRVQVVHINRLKRYDKRPQKVKPNELKANLLKATSGVKENIENLENTITTASKGIEIQTSGGNKENITPKQSVQQKRPVVIQVRDIRGTRPTQTVEKGGRGKTKPKRQYNARASQRRVLQQAPVEPTYRGRYNLRERTQPARY